MSAVAATFYPSLAVGDLVTADLLQSMVWKYYIKPSDEARNTTTTYADDTDLQGIALAVGNYHITLCGEFILSTTTTQTLKTTWGFSGTWNTPERQITGPGSTNTAATNVADTMNTRVQTTAQDAIYGCSASSNISNFREDAINVVVTVAGNLSLKWAQSASSANNTTVKANTTFIVRRNG